MVGTKTHFHLYLRFIGGKGTYSTSLAVPESGAHQAAIFHLIEHVDDIIHGTSTVPDGKALGITR